jgi:hypothetical protein
VLTVDWLPREMLNSKPTAASDDTIADPPMLRNGKGIPVKGIVPVMTATLINA